jgi:hypothetical protein
VAVDVVRAHPRPATVESPFATHRVSDLFVTGRLRDKRVGVVRSAVGTEGIDGAVEIANGLTTSRRSVLNLLAGA